MKNFIIAIIIGIIVPIGSISAADIEPSKDKEISIVTTKNPIIYNNTEYGFNFSLPENWQGYSIIIDTWSGTVKENTVAQSGQKILIRNPKWTAVSQYEDIPILIFTTQQWNAYLREDFSVGAAPMKASELARNNTYVFALPARWDFDYSLDYKEAQDIIAGNPLRAFDIGASENQRNIDLACNQAVSYMRFADAKSLEVFMADCKEGKHPEVIDKYKADMNLVDEANIEDTTIITNTLQFFGKLFIQNPFLALLPAFVLGLFYFQSRNTLILTTTILWGVYMIYEELHLLRIICSGECNIRIDLIFIYPVLIILSIIALFLGIRNLVKSLSL